MCKRTAGDAEIDSCALPHQRGGRRKSPLLVPTRGGPRCSPAPGFSHCGKVILPGVSAGRISSTTVAWPLRPVIHMHPALLAFPHTGSRRLQSVKHHTRCPGPPWLISQGCPTNLARSVSNKDKTTILPLQSPKPNALS